MLPNRLKDSEKKQGSIPTKGFLGQKGCVNGDYSFKSRLQTSPRGIVVWYIRFNRIIALNQGVDSISLTP